MMDSKRYWIAINGASCALASMPFEVPATTPVARQLIGFPTLKEAQEAQSICLHAPMSEVERFFEGLFPDIEAGRIRVIDPKTPEPPTHGPTQWMESLDESKNMAPEESQMIEATIKEALDEAETLLRSASDHQVAVWIFANRYPNWSPEIRRILEREGLKRLKRMGITLKE